MNGEYALALLMAVVSFILYIPFIAFLYKAKMTKDEEAGRTGLDGKPTNIIQKLHAHKKGTPIGGGILIVALVSLVFWFFSLYDDLSIDLHNKGVILLLSFVLFGAFGFYDDIRKIVPNKYSQKLHVPATVQLFVQLILAGIVSALAVFKFNLITLTIPFIGSISNIYLVFLITVLSIVFIANAYNIVDGLDGLGSGSLVITLLALSVILESLGSSGLPDRMFLWLLFGSVLGYLYYNINPARVFNGDAGTFGVGAVLAMFLLLNDLLWLAPFIYFVYIADALSSLIQGISKRYLGKKVFPIAPIHHWFELIGWPETKVTMRFWIANAFCALFSLALYFYL